MTPFMTDTPERSETYRDRPVLVMIASHWLSIFGVCLVATALITWIFVLPIHVRGGGSNPYLGIVVFIVVPMMFMAGLLSVPLGIYLARRRVRAHLAVAIVDRTVALRRLAMFLGLTALVNVVVGTQVTYRAVEQMESVQFCGRTCHVMTPQASSHGVSPHARVACVECHVGEGLHGWIESKAAGTRQLLEVVFNRYPRPVPSALTTGNLVPSRETCERCHWPEKFAATRLRVIPRFAEDEFNTETLTVLTMMVGGSRSGGIHGRHFGPGVEIRFAAADAQRQKIPWVEYRNTSTGEERVYRSEGAGAVPASAAVLMQCVDCHNRPTHTFALPDRALDLAFAGGWLPTTLPFLKRKGLEALKAPYISSEQAAKSIPDSIVEYYRRSHPEVYAARKADVESAGRYIAEIYGRNVFPDLNVTWGTYPNNLGHDTAPGCFRCHDDRHTSADGKTIAQDCSACHEVVSVDEASPEVLKTLGLAERLAAIRRK
jgi:hypothetical protein